MRNRHAEMEELRARHHAEVERANQEELALKLANKN